MLAEGEWNEQFDQERLMKSQKVQKDIEDLLDSTTNHNSGDGPTGQGHR
jgi:hypothetical protein